MKLRRLFHTILLSSVFSTAATPTGQTQAQRLPLSPLPTTDILAKTITPQQSPVYDSIGAKLAKQNKKYGSIVIDASNGNILMGTNIGKKLHPASVTKILTAYMVFEALENDQLKMEQMISVSKHAAGQEPSNIELKAGNKISVRKALEAMMVKSANDASVVLGEAISGSHSAFIKKMNQTAKELGMEDSRFVNANGLPYDLSGNRGNSSLTSVSDMAKLMRAIIEKYPQYYSYLGMESFDYKGKTIKSHNKLLPRIENETDTIGYWGMDGGKTGYTRASGCNLVCSATRNDMRLIAVTFGHEKGINRSADIKRLLDDGFKMLESAKKAKEIPPVEFLLRAQPDGTFQHRLSQDFLQPRKP